MPKKKNKKLQEYQIQWVYTLVGIQILLLAAARFLTAKTLFVVDSLPMIHQVNLIPITGGLVDPLIVGGRFLPFSSISYLMYPINQLVGLQAAMLVLQLFASVSLVYSSHQLVKRLGINGKKELVIMLLIAWSPTILAFSFVSPGLVLLLAMQLAGIVLISKKNKWGFVLMAISAAEGFNMVVMGIAWMILALKNNLIKLNEFITLLFIKALIISAVLVPQLIMHPRSAPLVTVAHQLSLTLIEFGALKGMSIIICSLAALGAMILYKRKYFVDALIVILLAGLSIWFESFRLPAALAMAVVIGMFIQFLRDYQWELKVLRTVSLGTIVVGIAGALIIMGTQIIGAAPTSSQINAMEWISENVPDDAVIFAQQDQGMIIEALAKRPVMLDNLLFTIPQARSRQNDTINLLNQVYLDQTQKILDNYSVSYLYLHPKITQFREEDDPSGGLLYLLQNSETFKSVYQDNGHRVVNYLKNGQEP